MLISANVILLLRVTLSSGVPVPLQLTCDLDSTVGMQVFACSLHVALLLIKQVKELIKASLVLAVT